MKDEVESQLSAMFDGELPAAECELLSRRIDRDERLRVRWARYVLIGASMRSEPVATASPGFAARVSAGVAALESEEQQASGAQRRRLPRPPRWMWQSALAAALVVAVAGLSLMLLRDAALNGTAPGFNAERSAVSAKPLQPMARVPTLLTASPAAPWSYVTPAGSERLGREIPLRSELADYIVAHSEYSTPLMRPDLLSALVTGEAGLHEAAASDQASGSVVSEIGSSGTGPIDAPAVASPAGH